MTKVFADYKRLLNDSWNAAYGNKILHILFIIKISVRHGCQPVIPIHSNIDDIFLYCNGIFELHDFCKLESIKVVHIEKSAFQKEKNHGILKKIFSKLFPEKVDSISLEEVLENSKEQYYRHREFLENYSNDRDYSVRGHFWHYDLMPSNEEMERYLRIRPEIEDYLINKYPTLERKNVVAVHYRETDFINHLENIFPNGLVLNTQYYMAARDYMEGVLGDDVEYHLFSDDIEKLSKIFDGKKIVVHNDKAHIDWVGLYKAKNIISSNSSFSWVASLYNKEWVVQPKGGYCFNSESGVVPHGFYIDKSVVINNEGRIVSQYE